MSRRTEIACLVLIVLTAMTVGYGLCASTAHADTPNCVTEHEYRTVDTGDTRDAVERVFDTTGAWVKRWTRSDDTQWLLKRYPGCRHTWSWVKVRYMALSGPYILVAKWHR